MSTLDIQTQQYTYTNTARQEHGTTEARQLLARQWHDSEHDSVGTTGAKTASTAVLPG